MGLSAFAVEVFEADVFSASDRFPIPLVAASVPSELVDGVTSPWRAAALLDIFFGLIISFNMFGNLTFRKNVKEEKLLYFPSIINYCDLYL